MKKTVLKSSLLAGVVSLLFSFSVLKSGSLTDITKPYLGEYECKNATFGDRDFTDEFSYIKLELKKDETFVLRYKTKQGRTGEETGYYTYNPNEESLCLSAGKNGEIKRRFPIKNGRFEIVLTIGSQLLQLTFEQN